MSSSDTQTPDDQGFRRVFEITVRMGLIFVLVAWCARIVEPFLIPIVWGVIIATAGLPGYLRLQGWMRGRGTAAAVAFTLLLLITLLVPAALLSTTLVDAAQILAEQLRHGTPQLPPPPESIRGWPVIGQPLSDFWELASENIYTAVQKLAPQLKAVGKWLLSSAAGVGLGTLQFMLAILIAGAILSRSEQARNFAHAVAERIADERGEQLLQVADDTVRNVARGILGVAFIQAVAAGIGFLAVGMPGAGLWALICLLLSVIQLGVLPVTLPAVFYVISTSDTAVAIAFTAWMVFVSVIDNILKPILLGRGAKVPMLVIFVGAIGGFLTAGILGLFVGAVTLVLGYKLFLSWVYGTPQVGPDSSRSEAP